MAEGKKAALVLCGNLFTGTTDRTFYGAVAIAGKKILAVGTREEIEPLIGNDTQIREFSKGLIMPGFIDAHAHFMDGAQMTSEHFCGELSKADSEEACVQMMVAFAARYPGLERYFGYGWLPSYWNDAPFPTKHSLDRYFPDTPVYLRAVDGHSEWMNTAALKESGYMGEWEPAYGSVDRFPDGEPTGLVREGGDALCRMYDTKLPPEEAEFLQRRMVKSLNAAGITSFTEMGAVLPDAITDVYRHVKKMEEAGELTVRLFLYPGTDVDPSRIGEIDAYQEIYHTDLLKIAGLKAFADGVTSTYTAAMTEPYEGREDKGYLNYPEERYREWVLKANAHGYGTRVHCIGDYAVHVLLDAYEASGIVNESQNLRNTIEHIEMIRPEDIQRFAQLNVVPSMQPLHLPLDEFDKINHCGIERSHYEWVHRSILNTGAALALGTDFPIADYTPIPNVYQAVTRKGLNGVQYGPYTPDECLTVAQTLRAYTWGSAYAVGMEHKIGTLEAGKYADITVIDRNLLTIPKEDIVNADILATVMDGRLVFEKEVAG
ncbi:MAG: amidohydrolase family protein [Lachnospiraceae bacterium]